MAINNYTPVLLFILFTPQVANADNFSAASGPYVTVSVSINHEANIGNAPEPPAHPTSISDPLERTKPVGASIFTGYLWASGWYTEIGSANLGVARNTIRRTGEDANFSYTSFGELEEKIRTLEARIGKMARVSSSVAAYIDVGAARYTEDVNTSTVMRQTDKNTLANTAASTASTAKTKGNAMVAGAGIAFVPNAPMAFKIGISKYSDIDRTSITFATQIGF